MNTQKVLLRNTITSYVDIILRMITGLLTTRFILDGLGKDLYGYWALLWTIFGYSLLLDFGFGTSVRKYTAEATVTKDFDKYNNFMSAILASYGLMSLVILSGSLITAYFFPQIFPSIPAERLSYYRQVFIIFGIGISLVFPWGVLREILCGLNRNDLCNYINITSTIINVTGVYLIFYFNHSIMTLAIFTLTTNIFSSILAWILTKKHIPSFRLSFCNFKLSHVKEIGSFSLFAYFATIATLVLYRTDTIVLGLMLNMSSVALFNIGIKVPLMMEQLVSQFQKNLGPIAATLYKMEDFAQIKTICYHSTRIVAFLAAGMFTTFFILIEPLLYIWLKVNDPISITIARITLISVLISVLFRSASFQFLQMAGKHKPMTYLLCIEALINIVLSIILIKHMGIIGVALGTLIPNAIISLFIVFPLFAKFSHTSILHYIKSIYIPISIAAVPLGLSLYFAKTYIPVEHWNLLTLISICAVAGTVYLIVSYAIFLNKDEKLKFRQTLAKLKIFRKVHY
ncbi:MAG: polysaccharide biosynthesis C-terminal domain-containing protein [Lentisphaeraceae bacterium]|nr:polysaccharide biosynthesis C-terminal domain-containing protein [Lentisphaeraceae bacterium]